jgi:hypothetical protein
MARMRYVGNVLTMARLQYMGSVFTMARVHILDVDSTCGAHNNDG